MRILDPTSGFDGYFTHSVGGRYITSLGDRLYLIDRSGTGLLRVEDSTFDATSISPDVTAMTNRHNAASRETHQAPSRRLRSHKRALINAST